MSLNVPGFSSSFYLKIAIPHEKSQPPLKAEVLSSPPFLKIWFEVQPLPLLSPRRKRGGRGGGQCTSCLHRTSIQKWKKNWFCFVHKWIGKKEMPAKKSKCLCWILFIGAAAQISCVQRSQSPCNFEKVYYFAFKYLDLQHKISIVLWLSYLWKHLLFIWRQWK